MWVPHDVRDQIVDFVRRWSEASETGAGRFVGWGVTASKFYDWRQRYGSVNEHTVGFTGTFGFSTGRKSLSSPSM